jgi:tryptophan-rich sensory protein
MPIWVLVCFLAPALGSWSRPGEWYALLNKPAWNPPSWIFGPVWTLLYLCMGLAAWLVWRRGGLREQRTPLLLFFTQLALNALWTPLFFGLHQPGLALVNILFLWAAIIATIAAFRRVSGKAAALLLPYLAWVSFASFLNFTLWRLNS